MSFVSNALELELAYFTKDSAEKIKPINKKLEIIMRKCVRCNTAMVENCGVKVKGAAYGLILTDDENKWWGGRMEQPKVAICPKCGEVSIYLENVEKLKNKQRTS